MKPFSVSLPTAAAALFTGAVFALATLAQTPPTQASGPQPPHSHPAPTNLKVLRKSMTGEQVHDLMEQWEGSLGAHCNNCHTPDPKNIGPNGRPRLNFADDSKPEKATARLMYTMTEDINKNYVGKIDTSGAPVTCGTCHRGHLSPEPFIIPNEDGPPPPPTAAKPEPPK